MSACSEYKIGAISEDEFRRAMRMECEDVDPFDGYNCYDCASHKDCSKQVLELGYPQCDDKDKYFEEEIEQFEAKQEQEKQ